MWYGSTVIGLRTWVSDQAQCHLNQTHNTLHETVNHANHGIGISCPAWNRTGAKRGGPVSLRHRKLCVDGVAEVWVLPNRQSQPSSLGAGCPGVLNVHGKWHWSLATGKVSTIATLCCTRVPRTRCVVYVCRQGRIRAGRGAPCAWRSRKRNLATGSEHGRLSHTLQLVTLSMVSETNDASAQQVRCRQQK